jgi:3-methyladenine DNA glycosylase AlkD
MIDQIKRELLSLADEERAKILQRFFKTGEGEYGEGDIFIGITTPEQRIISKKYSSLPLAKIQELLDSKIHEERSVGGLILTYKYEKSNEEEKANIANFYLKNAKKFNNWDLVDLTAPKVLGNFLLYKKSERKVLYDLAKSKNLWEKRISIISTFAFIRKGEFEDTLEISKLLLNDSHDLLHKAVGWMLREVGKKDEKILKEFLKGNYSNLKRTTLRYSIERFPEEERKMFLGGKFNDK